MDALAVRRELEDGVPVSTPSVSSSPPVMHLCPKCLGQGFVNTPPFVAGDQPTWLSNTSGGYTCRVCFGRGYLLV